MYITYKYYVILCKGLEHPQISVPAGVLEPIRRGYRGMVVHASSYPSLRTNHTDMSELQRTMCPF